MKRLSSSCYASSIFLALALAASPVRASDVIEFYNEALDHYFITNNSGEIRDLDTGVHRGWTRTGEKFQVFDAGDPRLGNSIAVCRFYGNPARGLDSHFYSATPQECTEVMVRFPDAWLLESADVFRVHRADPNTGLCPANSKSVYRLYNVRPDVNHRYTTEPGIVDAMLAKGYVMEGFGPTRPVAFCGADPNPPPPPPPPPACSLAASNTSPDVNTTLTLVATCSSAPTSYAWTNCTTATNTCTTTALTAGSQVYSVRASNATGTSAPASISVTWRQPVTGPPACSLSAAPSSPFVGGVTTLTAACTQSPTSFSWTNCANATGNTCQATSTQTGPVTYSVTAANGFGASAPASLTLNWLTAPPPGADLCGSFAKVLRIDLNWGGFKTTNDPGGGFEDDMVLVGRFTVPADASGTSVPGVISAVEFVDGPAGRVMSLSRSACDFRGFTPNVFPTPDPTGTSAPLGWAFGINPSLQFALSTMPGQQPKLVPGQTYYINIRNSEFGGGPSTCPTPECNLRVTVNAPR